MCPKCNWRFQCFFHDIENGGGIFKLKKNSSMAEMGYMFMAITPGVTYKNLVKDVGPYLCMNSDKTYSIGNVMVFNPANEESLAMCELRSSLNPKKDDDEG